MGGFFLFRIAVLHHRRNYRFDLRVVLLASDAETGLVLRDADALFRGIYKAKVKDLLVRLAVLFLPIEIPGDIDRIIDDVQHRQDNGEYKV